MRRDPLEDTGARRYEQGMISTPRVWGRREGSEEPYTLQPQLHQDPWRTCHWGPARQAGYSAADDLFSAHSDVWYRGAQSESSEKAASFLAWRLATSLPMAYSAAKVPIDAFSPIVSVVQRVPHSTIVHLSVSFRSARLTWVATVSCLMCLST